MTEKIVVEVQYIGRHGRGHHKAYCSGVGEVYYLQIVEVTPEVAQNLPPEEWRPISFVCRHIRMNGELCPNEKGYDSLLCPSCQTYFRQQVTK